MSDLDGDVVIVGGGPVGLGLAIELGQRGIRAHVVEKYDAPQPVPKGQNLTQRTMEHFAAWGVERSLRVAVTIPKSYGIGGLTAYGSLLSGIHYDWLQRDLVRGFYSQDNERLPQYATEAVLRQRVSEIPCIRFHKGWNATGLTQHAGCVEVETHHRETGAIEKLRARFAVGCDGSRSMVREAAGITQTRTDHDRLMVLLVFHSSALQHFLERFPGKSYYNVLHPDMQGYWQFFGRVDLEGNFFFHAPVPPGAKTGEFDFENLLCRAVGATIDVSISYKGFWDLRFAQADQYRAGQVFIAGDAAHSHPPYGGYGINSGFEDARNLGWKLAADIQGWAGPTLLDSYCAERHPVFQSTIRDFIAKSINSDREFLERFSPNGDAEAFARHWQVRAASAPEEVASFAPHYGGSPIVASNGDEKPSARGSHSLKARSGRHLAPAKMNARSHVINPAGDDFTLITNDIKNADAFKEAAARLRIPLKVMMDQAPAYGANQILVRPDHFVAWTDADGGSPLAVLRQAVGYEASQSVA